METADVVESESLLPPSWKGYREILQAAHQPLEAALPRATRQRRWALRGEAEEPAELGMQAVEHHRRVPCLLLPRREPFEVGGMEVPDTRRRRVHEPKPLLLQAIAELDVF